MKKPKAPTHPASPPLWIYLSQVRQINREGGGRHAGWVDENLNQRVCADIRDAQLRPLHFLYVLQGKILKTFVSASDADFSGHNTQKDQPTYYQEVQAWFNAGKVS